MAKKFWQICIDDGALGGWFCLITSIILILTAFFVPPLAYIDGSVLMAVGELFAFGALFKLPNIIKSIKDGKSLRMSKGGFEVEVKSEKEKKDE